MTCVAAIAKGGRVWMAADRYGVDSAFRKSDRADPKVFVKSATKGCPASVWGYTSSFRMGQLLEHTLDMPTLPQRMGVYQWSVVHLIPAIIRCLERGQWITKTSDQISGGQFLVGIRGEILTVETDFQVARTVVNYAAVGCGVDIAMGALYVMAPFKSPVRCLRTAVRAASEFSAGVGPVADVRSAN